MAFLSWFISLNQVVHWRFFLLFPLFSNSFVMPSCPMLFKIVPSLLSDFSDFELSSARHLLSLHSRFPQFGLRICPHTSLRSCVLLVAVLQIRSRLYNINKLSRTVLHLIEQIRGLRSRYPLEQQISVVFSRAFESNKCLGLSQPALS